ncbi:PASTA domain-containing protein [Streptomyces albiflavescens]|uniref:PASTA domain-containing protein n=1 Tax=Streptomyces albiflavescens TaxID=1623582 RepID=UPI00166DE14E|nr:PASTA domain-containing protein [Streptomyces albiflavescens]
MAAGISQASPFFKEDGKLGRDTRVPEARPAGGVQASNSPGLYGGTPGGGNSPGGDSTGGNGTGGDSTGGDSTGGDNGSPGQDGGGGSTGEFGGSTKPGTCVVAKLKKFLTAPENSAKAREWARVLHISTAEIPNYIDQLTPVVLRHDTLVTNHEYKHGKAVPFDALLQAGIAILVDKQGLPAVKCSCGNPLRPSEVNIKKTSVQFKDGNKKWSGYRQDHIVIVEPPPGNPKIDRLQLIDVDDPDRGIARELGVDGDDTSFDPHAQQTVPAVTGMTFAQAAQNLTDAGLALAYDGDTLPPDDAQVTASQPVQGSTLEWGASVTLFVQSADDGQSTPQDSGGVTTGPDESSTGPGGASTGPGESSTGPGGVSTGPDESTTGPGESSTGPSGSSTGPGGSSTGPSGSSTGPGTTPSTTSTAPTTGGTDSPPVSGTTPPSTSTSGSATSSESVSTAPLPTQPTDSGAPGSSDSSSVDPGVSDSAPGASSSATDATDSGGLTGGTS